MGFNPRAPRGGATHGLPCVGVHLGVSIHAPRVGARLARSICMVISPRGFNPRAPRGGATRTARRHRLHRTGFNPRAPRGGATFWWRSVTVQVLVSIHAPRVGARPTPNKVARMDTLFQSTRPAWGRDASSVTLLIASASFNPRAPRGGATPNRA